MFLRYCCAHLLNYTVPVPYRTVRYIGPSSSACTTVLHSYRTLFTSKHYSPCSYCTRTVGRGKVQYRTVRVFPQVRYCCAHLLNYGTGTVPQCTVLRPLSCLYLLYEYATVLYCTVLYCTVLYCTVLYCTVLYCTVLYCTVLYCTVFVPYFISNNILRAGTSTGSYSTGTVVYSSTRRSVSYRSTGVSTVQHIEILQYATNTRTVAGYCNIYI